MLNINKVREYLSLIWPQWKIVNPIGTGSFGSTVYVIVRDDLGTRYTSALKVLQMNGSFPESGMPTKEISQGCLDVGERTLDLRLERNRNSCPDREILEDFEHSVSSDINLMMQLKGLPNIVTIEDTATLWRDNQCIIMIRMELLESLESYVTRKNGMEFHEIIKMGIDICTALEACEQKNILHLDINPSNIFRNEHGIFKLGDFGIFHTMASIYERMSGNGMVGVRQYIAPEIFAGESYGKTADIYSVSMCLYVLLNGNNPHIIIGGVLPPLQCENPNIADIISKGCNPRPECRFQSAGEFLTALRSVSDEPLIGDSPSGHPFRFQKQIIAVVACICILSIAIIILKGAFKHDTVSYTVIYEDESGNVLDKKTRRGKPGSEITEAGVSFDGYTLLSEPAEFVLSINEEKNVIHLQYKKEVSSEIVTYTVLSTDINGVTLAQQVKEGAVGEEISESSPDIEGYYCPNSTKSIILSKTPEENTIVFLYENTNTSTAESKMDIPSDAITYGGHSYYLYDNDCKNWDDVLSFCEGKGGYPAVINDSGENEKLYEYMLFMGRKAALIGFTDRDTEGLWKWVEGKNSTFTDWGTNNEGELEPNSDSKNEDYAQLDLNMNNGYWNDCAFGHDTQAFFCEWDGIKQTEGKSADQEESEATAKPTETYVGSNSAPLAVTDDVLCMYAKDAASFLGFSEKAEYHEPDIEYTSYYYIQKGRDLFDGSSRLEYFPEYDMTGHWNLYIGDKSISFQGVTIGMEYSKVKSILQSNGWSYDRYSDEDVEDDDSIYYEKDLPNDWEYGFVTVEFEDGKAKSIIFYTDGD